MVVAGALVGLVALHLSGRRVNRTRYRPERLRAPEWVILASGVVAGLGMSVVGAAQPLVAHPPTVSLQWPQVSLAALLSVLVLVAPVFVAPLPAGSAPVRRLDPGLAADRVDTPARRYRELIRAERGGPPGGMDETPPTAPIPAERNDR